MSTRWRARQGAAWAGAVLLAGLLAAPPALADRPAATAAMPADSTNPFLRVVSRDAEKSEFDVLPRLPDYAAYADGTLLVQKDDRKLWVGKLTPDQTLDLLDFALSDVGLGTLALDYKIHSPFSSARTEYTLQTRSGRNSVQRFASGGLGSGVADAERALGRLDARLFQMAGFADKSYEPPRLFVVSRRVQTDGALPVWASNETVPFGAFVDATDAALSHGTIVSDDAARAVGQAIAQSAVWRFGTVACEFRSRPAFPEEMALPAWRSPAVPLRPPTAPPPPLPSGPAPIPASPPAAPAPGTPPSPAAAPASDWRDDDLDFAALVTLLKDLKRKASGSPHGVFWNKPYADFVAFAFDAGDGRVRLLVKGDSAKSNLVRALEGKPLSVTLPDGTTKDQEFALMPPRGGPVPAADIERIRRWIDHGCPETKPAAAAGPGTTPSPSGNPGPLPKPPDATVTGTVPLALVSERSRQVLSATATAEDGDAAPTLYVACSGEAWARVFDEFVRKHRGENGIAVADALAPIRDAVKNYDWTGSPLLVLLGPVNPSFWMEVSPQMETLSDGSARITVKHSANGLPAGVATVRTFRWAIYRADGRCPQAVTLRDATTGKDYPAANRE